jgi:hypothetical protein
VKTKQNPREKLIDDVLDEGCFTVARRTDEPEGVRVVLVNVDGLEVVLTIDDYGTATAEVPGMAKWYGFAREWLNLPFQIANFANGYSHGLKKAKQVQEG